MTYHTLIVALACKNGIVMCSDGQATVLSTGGPIREAVVKIKRIGDSVLWAGSGDIGVIQKIEKYVQALPTELKRGSIEEIKEPLTRIVHDIRKENLTRFRELYGQEGERKAPFAEIIVADYRNKKPLILHISRDAEVTELQEFGYGITGIGDTFAYTILKNYDICNCSIEQGKIVAYRVIRDAIDVGAYGLGEPIDIWTISANNGVIQSQKVGDEEMRALQDTLNALREAEVEAFRRTRTQD